MIVPLTISDRNLSVRLTRTQVVPSAISQKFGRTSALQLNLHSNRFGSALIEALTLNAL